MPGWWSGLRLALNVSILYPELPVVDRPVRVQDEGFTLMESWWPFDTPTPSGDERSAFVASIRSAGLQMVLLNTFAGDMAAGDRGLGAVPGREDEFWTNFSTTLSIATELDCPHVHVLLGNRGGASVETVESTGLANLTSAARAAQAVGRRVLVEVLNSSDNPDYVMTDLDRAIAWISEVRSRVGPDSIALLFDAYHLTRLGHDLPAAFERASDVVGHVQIADVPGRGAPGTGTIDFAGFADVLRSEGYDGFVSLEYVRAVDDSFDWMSA